MRIAQVAPLMESVPPKQYGGTERVVSWLTEELVRLGHDVTLFASGDSVTSAELVSCWPNGLRLIGRPCARSLTTWSCWIGFIGARTSLTSFTSISTTCISLSSAIAQRIP